MHESLFGDGQPGGATAGRRREPRERDLPPQRARRAGVARNGQHRKDCDGDWRRTAGVRGGGESSDDEIEGEHDASQRLLVESLSGFPNRTVVDRLLREARHHGVDRRELKWFRRQDGAAKYPDEKWEPRSGRTGHSRLRRRTKPRSRPQYAAFRPLRLAGHRISRNRGERNFCRWRSGILSRSHHGWSAPPDALGERASARLGCGSEHDRQKKNSLRTNPLFLDGDVRSAAALCRRFQLAADSGRSPRHLRQEKVSGALLSRRETARDPAL